MTIVDAHFHISNERDADRRPVVDGDVARRLMDGPFPINGVPRIVDKALIQPMVLPTRHGDPMDHHAYTLGQIEKHPDRFIGSFVANPFLDMDRNLEVMRHLVEEGGFRAMKLHPTVHSYVPFRSRHRLDPLIEQAEDLGIVVMVHQGDPPYAYPSQFVPVIEAFPNVTFLLAHFATQRVVMADEAVFVASQFDNVHIETSWGDLPRIKEGVATLGPERLVFGSDCPINEVGSQIRPIEVLGWDEPMGMGLSDEQVEGILGNNLLSLLGLSV